MAYERANLQRTGQRVELAIATGGKPKRRDAIMKSYFCTVAGIFGFWAALASLDDPEKRLAVFTATFICAVFIGMF